jgi:hypothetical protein
MVAAVTAAAVELTPFLGGGPMTIPCYVSGKGMYATDKTRQFKVSVMETLEATGMGYDTRHRYYQQQFPTMAASALAQMICDPIEYYDRGWAAYQAAHGAGCEADEVLTAFMLERDARFRQEAQVAIYCYDEAGFGSGLNTMRFLQAEKPILGFYHAEIKQQPGHVGVLPEPRRHRLDPADLASTDGCIQEDPMMAGVYLQVVASGQVYF